MVQEKKRLIIIDCNSIIHRAFHALPPLSTRGGELVNAVYGFLLVFFKAVREFQPNYITACFDYPAATFRHEKYKGYKAKRPPTPPDLYQQIPKVKEVLRALNVQIFEKEGFEGDDVIGTIARQASRKQVFPAIETIILSGDLDTLQLIDSFTKVYVLRKGVKDTVLYDEKLVQERYQGLRPRQLLDFRALKGDPSDNIPGVAGVGEKTAVELLREFETIENLYQNLALVKNKLRVLLAKYKEEAFLSKELARIHQNVPLEFNLQRCQWGDYDKEKMIQILKNYEFYSLISRLLSPGAVATGR